MPISFANIPANIKVPLYWVEVDPSMAGLPTINLRALLVGVMTADGEAEPDIPRPIGRRDRWWQQRRAGGNGVSCRIGASLRIDGRRGAPSPG